MLLVTLALGVAVAVGVSVDGRSLGARLAHSLLCAVRGGCDDGRSELAQAYGERDAALVRRYAPNIVYEPGIYTLPVDFRECRAHHCSDAPDDRDLDVHRATRSGARATAFTRVIRRDGETFIQYWLYYPDSNTTVAKSAAGWKYVVQPWSRTTPVGRVARLIWPGLPYRGFHRDDWESHQVRIAGDGRVTVRSSSHKHYQWCKRRKCRNQWGPWTGWTRVSRGSQAGHIPVRDGEPAYPGRDMRERTTTAPGLRLVPLERVDTKRYVPLNKTIVPPWRKKVYTDPLSDSTK